MPASLKVGALRWAPEDEHVAPSGLLLLFFTFITTCLGKVYFKTEPDFQAHSIDIETTSPDLAQGYYFVATVSPTPDEEGWNGFGPQIYDSNGDLIWNGNASTTHRAMRFHTCTYLQKPVLCWHDGARDGRSRSTGVIRMVDDTYTHIEDFDALGDLNGPDAHEINTVADGEILLQDVYEIRQADLRPYGGDKDGYFLDVCFQEVEIESHELLFQWCAYEQLPLWETNAWLHTSSNYTGDKRGPGHGTAASPWDVWHINGMDKNTAGDYIVSLRHSDTIYKIAGANSANPGSVLWRLRGTPVGDDKGTFALRNNLSFHGQHTARSISLSTTSPNKSTELLALFNNGEPNEPSNGQLILLDYSSTPQTATLIQSYIAPRPRHASKGDTPHSTSAGNMDLLDPSKHVVLGWGHQTFSSPSSSSSSSSSSGPPPTNAAFSEYAPNGTLLLHATFPPQGASQVYSPQTWKSVWHADPAHPPKALSYAAACDARSMSVYASWNGATEVSAWRVHASNVSETGPWVVVAANVPRTGFETRAELAGDLSRWVYVEALDASGHVLRASGVVETFIPSRSTMRKWDCDERGCADGFAYSKGKGKGTRCLAAGGNLSVGDHYGVGVEQVVALALVCTALEIWVWYFQLIVLRC